MYLKTNALVLRETAYQDADKLLSLLTPDHGCLTARARGVRSRSSRLKAACQLLTYGEFTLLERQGRYTITEAVMLNPFQKLRDDLEKLSLGSYLAQLGETPVRRRLCDPGAAPSAALRAGRPGAAEPSAGDCQGGGGAATAVPVRLCAGAGGLRRLRRAEPGSFSCGRGRTPLHRV